MVKNSVDDRRRGLRAHRILSIRHRLHKRGTQIISDKNPWYLSATENMSFNGILFSSSAPYEKEDIIEIEVVMSAVLDIFRGFGRVVRVEKKAAAAVYQVAVTLIDLKGRQKNTEQRTVKNLPLKKQQKKSKRIK